MGGQVSVGAPLSERLAAILRTKYEQYSGRGCDDAEIQAILDEKLPSIVCFDQVDRDHSGAVDRQELQAFLRALPRHKPVVAPGEAPPAFVPFERMVATLDADGDGLITLKEWLENSAALPGLEAALRRAVDPATGLVAGAESLDAALARLEARRDAGGAREGDDAEIGRLRGVVGTAGLTVFRQIDADGSGKIDRAELVRAIAHLNRYTDAPLDAAATAAALDRDGDDLIDEREWVAQLYLVPRLKATIEATVDPATGRVKGYLEEEHRAAVAKARGDWARSAADLLAAVDAGADARAPAAAPAAAVEAK